MGAIQTEGLVKQWIAGAAVNVHRIAKLSTGKVIHGAAATDSLIGVLQLGAANDQDVPVMHTGISDVEYGGTVTEGALLTSDATGKAVVTSTAGNGTIGRALIAGADGDIGAILLSIGSV